MSQCLKSQGERYSCHPARHPGMCDAAIAIAADAHVCGCVSHFDDCMITDRCRVVQVFATSYRQFAFGEQGVTGRPSEVLHT